MEIAFLVIAVIGLLALSSGSSGGGSIRGGLSYTPDQNNYPNTNSDYYGPAQPWTPTLPSTVGAPMTPSTGTNVTGQLFTGSAAVGTAALTTTHAGLGVLGSIGIAGHAVPIVGTAIAVAAAIAAGLLAAHQKRLTDAKNENAAVDQWIPVFDSFVKQTTEAYNAGKITAQQAASICQQFDYTLYNKFRSFVGQPGTAWNDQIGMSGQCNKSCTVGCCVYFGDLGPVLNNMSYVLGFPTAKWGQGDPRIKGRTIIVPKVFPSKYSSLSRESYQITLN